MARRYEIIRFKAGQWSVRGVKSDDLEPSFNSASESVTTYDARDVEPLVGAARAVIAARREIATGSYLPNTQLTRQLLGYLANALATFEEQR